MRILSLIPDSTVVSDFEAFLNSLSLRWNVVGHNVVLSLPAQIAYGDASMFHTHVGN